MSWAAYSIARGRRATSVRRKRNLGITISIAFAACAIQAQPALAQGGISTLLPALVVSATTIPTPAEQIASSVTVITADEIERTQRRTIPDLLNTVPGLHVVQNGTPGTQTAVFIRGTNSNHVRVLIDGIDVGDPSTPNGAVDFGYFLASDLERVEVLRGPQSGLYGANAIGGVISMTTKKGSGPARVTARVEAGSFKTFNQNASLSGSTDRFNYSFNVTHFYSGDMPTTPAYMVPPGASAIGNFYENWTLSTRLGADLSEQFSVNLYGRYIDSKLRFSNDDFFAFPGVTYPVQSTGTARIFIGRAEGVWSAFDGRLVNVFGVNMTDYRRNTIDPPMAPTIESPFNGTRVKGDWRSTFTIMPGHKLVAGIEREDEKASGATFSANSGNTGGFAEIQSEFVNRIFIVANIRHDRNDQFGDATTWRLAPAVILPVTDTKLKASYGTGFKAPTLYELFGTGAFGYVGNPNLQPERSRGWDAGFEQPFGGDRMRVGVTYFNNDIDNLITNVFFPVNTYINVREAKTYGAEMFAEAKITDRLRTRFDYTRTIARNVTLDQELVRRPRDKYTFTTVWEPLDGLTFNGTVIYLGRWLDFTRDTGVNAEGGGVTVVNLAAKYVVNQNATVFARIDNLFDVRYENPLGWQQPSFGIFGGVKVSNY